LLPEDFLDRILGPGAPLRTLVIGADFKMGRGRVGDRAYLEALGKRRGFTVVQVPFLMGEEDAARASAPGSPAATGGATKLSSTPLRRGIEGGTMEAAESLMGRPYALEGVVGSGAGRGTDLGFPTANLEIPPRKLLPPAGIYLSDNEVGGTTTRGLTYVG